MFIDREICLCGAMKRRARPFCNACLDVLPTRLVTALRGCATDAHALASAIVWLSKNWWSRYA